MHLHQPLAPLVLLALLLPVSGDPPAWWRDGDQPVIDPSAPTNNHGPANIGQAKWMARQALTAMQAVDAASAAAVTAELVGPGKPLANWDAPVTQAQRTAQRAPLLCGQLKAIGAPFYQQLHARNPAWLSAERELNQTRDLTDDTNIYPWPATTSAAANHAMATIGQLKAVFSLRFETYDMTLDNDHDGLSNAEERILGTDPNNPQTLAGYPDAWLAINYYDDLINGDIMTIVPDYDADGDGLNNAQEAELGSNPNVPDNPGIMQEALRNGDFSNPQIGSGLHYTSSSLIWDYWGGGVDAWTAVVGSNVEFQSIEPNYTTTQSSGASSADNPYAELKAHPAGHYGIKQRVGTRIDANYMVVFECKARQKITPYDNNFTVNIDGAVVKDITFETIEPWATKAASFKATSNITEISLVPYNNIDDTKGGLVDNVRLVPVEVAVDADRNGTIDFIRDRTTADKPLRFWINNDQDDVETDEPIMVEKPDCFDRETIKTRRDLEDFCRLKVQVGLPNQKLRDGEFQIGLKFQDNAGSKGPSIRIWPNQSPVGSLDYLNDINAASAQICYTAFEKYTPDLITLIPTSYWAGRDDSTAHLIFEGTAKGKGKLVVTLHDNKGALLTEAAGLWLDLLDVREMYQRARIVNEAEQIPDPWINQNPPAQTWTWDPWKWQYADDVNADPVTAVFVHGWRLKYMDYMNWSDTSYKRLWHQGFKGKFYSFRWACFSGDNNGLPYGLNEELEAHSDTNPLIIPPGGLTYNASEYRAWLCGPALASFVNQLPNPGVRSLFAHSMGNVIAGAALRAGMLVDYYAMCNAAMAAMAYDPNQNLRNVDGIFLPGSPHKTPDSDPNPTISTGYGLENKFNLASMPTVFNFGLPNDQKLGMWSANNLYCKPNTQYLYTENSILQPFPLVYQATPISAFRIVAALPEAMGYVTKSRTRAAGADLRTKGAIGVKNTVSMHDWFNETHSAQWRWNNQATMEFWRNLVEVLILKQTAVP